MFKGMLAAVAVLLLAMTAAAKADCAPDEECWGAVAAGLWNDSDGSARVASGAAWNYPSRTAAGNGAMQQCNAQGYNCEVVGTFSNGACGYIAVGQNSSQVSWYTGSSAQEAYNRCQNGGFQCSWPPAGGCTADR